MPAEELIEIKYTYGKSLVGTIDSNDRVQVFGLSVPNNMRNCTGALVPWTCVQNFLKEII